MSVFLTSIPRKSPRRSDPSGRFAAMGQRSRWVRGATPPLTGSQPAESSFGIGLSSGIRPNKMQESALEALDVLHRRHESCALLVSATGTGKTYLSALDVASTKPSRVLFIAHRQRILDASMASYRKVLDHFKPKFVLGMTATPSRTDGYDVYSLFNHVIAYRIMLQDALENDMLVPFHYFVDRRFGDRRGKRR